jgi:hypothetical protein
MFSFASKMLNTLIGEGEQQGPGVGGPRGPAPRAPTQGQPPRPGPYQPRVHQMNYPRPLHQPPLPVHKGLYSSEYPICMSRPYTLAPAIIIPLLSLLTVEQRNVPPATSFVVNINVWLDRICKFDYLLIDSCNHLMITWSCQ